MDKRTLKGTTGKIAGVLAVATMCFALLYLLGIFNLLGVTIMPVAYSGLMSGAILALTLWLLPGTKGSTEKIPWYDLGGDVSLIHINEFRTLT